MRIGDWAAVRERAKLAIFTIVAVAGFVAWIMLPELSDAEDQSTPEPAAVATAPEIAPPEIAAPETTTPASSPLDGLQISAQSWRRGGLGSKALVTLTLRNRNDFAVRDVEIACAFARRDGSHLTDRKRVINDVINMKSRKTYSGMLVGFVNIDANKAKCSVVTASRI
jgi:hypothetical protein